MDGKIQVFGMVSRQILESELRQCFHSSCSSSCAVVVPKSWLYQPAACNCGFSCSWISSPCQEQESPNLAVFLSLAFLMQLFKERVHVSF